jgi:archaellum component FlaG (FlaF/FlaG flagellin family)
MDYLVLNATIQNTGDNDFPFTLNSFQIIGDSSIGAWHPPIAAVLSQTGVLTDTLNESEVIPAKSSITGVIFFTIVKSVKMCNFSVQDSLGTSVSEVDNINAIPISEVQIPQIPIEHLNITEKAAMKTTPSGYEEVMGMLGQHIVLPSIPNDTFLLTLKTTIQNTGNSNLTFRQNSFSLICNAPIPASHMPWVDLFGGNVAFPLNKTVVFPANSSTDGFFFITNYRNASNCRFTVSDSLGNTVGDLDLASLDTFAAPEAPPTTSSR